MLSATAQCAAYPPVQKTRPERGISANASMQEGADVPFERPIDNLDDTQKPMNTAQNSGRDDSPLSARCSGVEWREAPLGRMGGCRMVSTRRLPLYLLG